MIDLLKLHKHFILTHLKEGDVAVDFTMGNGYDTLFLANAVGETGKVYAFDVQQQALDNTRQRLTEAGVADRCTLILDSHQRVKDYVPTRICAGMINLGFLPGADFDYGNLRKKEPNLTMLIPLLILAAATVALGIFPNPLTDCISALVKTVL